KFVAFASTAGGLRTCTGAAFRRLIPIAIGTIATTSQPDGKMRFMQVLIEFGLYYIRNLRLT
ncbi:MAG: hypothetical protein ABIN36_16910, partial [Ferruginibacter sp.]